MVQFLDVFIKKSPTGFIHSHFEEPTHTGFFLVFSLKNHHPVLVPRFSRNPHIQDFTLKMN